MELEKFVVLEVSSFTSPKTQKTYFDVTGRYMNKLVKFPVADQALAGKFREFVDEEVSIQFSLDVYKLEPRFKVVALK